MLSATAGDRLWRILQPRLPRNGATGRIGHSEESLSEAEKALEFFSGLEGCSQQELATLELAASLLALGDVSAAIRTTEAVRSRMSGLNAYNLLRADMILAEGERRLGNREKAIAILMNHEEHVLTESSNWQIAMYCRAFPELLGLFALSMDPDQLPTHLVRMILQRTASG